MIEIDYKDIVTDELSNGAWIRDDHTGFREDYLTLHCLLRKYQPKTVWETGSNTGEGVNVIATALPEAKIFSLDLDYETMLKNPGEFPIGSNGEDRTGSAAKFPYTQLRGDSISFDYSPYPCEAAFIDGCHDYAHPRTEAMEMIKNSTKLIIFHDADVFEVGKAITDAFKLAKYDVYRVTGTRIAYAVKKEPKPKKK